MGKLRPFSRQGCVSRVCSIRVFLSKTDPRYSERRFTLWLTPRLPLWIDNRVSLNAASHPVIDAASHQEDRVSICDWRCVSSKRLSEIWVPMKW